VDRRCDDTIDKKRVKSCVSKHLFLEGVEQLKNSPKKSGSSFRRANNAAFSRFHGWPLHESFSQDTYSVLKQALWQDPTGATVMRIVSDCILWIRDIFAIEGAHMTFTLRIL